MRKKGKRKRAAARQSWAQFRFSVVGALLASPPEEGKLQEALEELADKQYLHPIHQDLQTKFGFSTIERWYYKALSTLDPMPALARKLRSDAGKPRVFSAGLLAELEKSYRKSPSWSYQLHHDNLEVIAKKRPELGDMPSYTTLCRRMVERGWVRRRSTKARTEGQKRAAERLEKREVRSYEASHVHALWHLDFHEAKRRVVDVDGNWHTPVALGILDDRSRVGCHAQWYLGETAENLVHGLGQGFAKRGLPRALMTDNGSAMLAHETRNGLSRLGILHQTTLTASPYQNGKQECFWASLEGRLLAMLKHVEPLTLAFLNQATQAWLEMEYNLALHRELGTTPLKRLLEGPDLSRPAPDAKALRLAFSVEDTRSQRKSDGTLTIDGVRFEVPNRFRNLSRLTVRWQSWNLASAFLVDPRTGDVLARLLPQDKAKNADGRRRALEPLEATAEPSASPDEDPIPPLLQKLLADYAATGLPPAYIPKDERARRDGEDDDE